MKNKRKKISVKSFYARKLEQEKIVSNNKSKKKNRDFIVCSALFCLGWLIKEGTSIFFMGSSFLWLLAGILLTVCFCRIIKRCFWTKLTFLAIFNAYCISFILLVFIAMVSTYATRETYTFQSTVSDTSKGWRGADHYVIDLEEESITVAIQNSEGLKGANVKGHYKKGCLGAIRLYKINITK